MKIIIELSEYKAVYQKNSNAIFINPNTFKTSSITDMTTYIAHELFHAYQYKNDPSIFDTQKEQNYERCGIDYIKQPLEIVAYAFQTAIIMMYEECYAEFNLNGVDSDTLKRINELAEDYYQKYKDKFENIISTVR